MSRVTPEFDCKEKALFLVLSWLHNATVREVGSYTTVPYAQTYFLALPLSFLAPSLSSDRVPQEI